MSAAEGYRAALRISERMRGQRIFFILGCQKSGTTWLQHLLDGHPAVACGGEGHFGDLLVPLFSDLFAGYLGHEKMVLTLTPDEMLSIVRFTTDRLLHSYLRRGGAAREGIEAIGDKTPETALVMPALVALYPEARFIHLLRDGRDAAVSGWAHLERRGHRQGCAFADYAEIFAREHWRRYVSAAREFGRRQEGRYLEVRYEALHADPRRQTRRMLRFLEVDDGDAAVAGCVEAGSFTRLSGGRQRGEEDPRSHYRKGVVADWKNRFDGEALRRFEAVAGTLLDELGYPRGAPAAVS